METIAVRPRSRHAAFRPSWSRTPPFSPGILGLYPDVSTYEHPTSRQASMIRMLCSGSVAFTATSASARTRRRAYGSFTSASRAWRVAVLPRDFRARERSPRLSAITISSTRGSDANSRVMILPSPPVPRIAACTSHRCGRRRLEVSTSFSSGERRSVRQIHDALGARVDVEPVSPGEADEGHAEFLRDGHREAGRRPDRDHERDAHDGGFLRISKLLRPLTARTVPVRGVRPARNA